MDNCKTKLRQGNDVCGLDWLICNIINTWIVYAFMMSWLGEWMKWLLQDLKSWKTPPSNFEQPLAREEKKLKKYSKCSREREGKRERRKGDSWGFKLGFSFV